MKYELMVILDPKQTDKEIEKNLKEVKNVLTENDFKIVDEDLWGIRDLAYRIKGRPTGYYVVLNCEGEGAGMVKVHQDLTLQAGVLRYLLMHIPEDYTLMRYEDKLMTTGAKQKLSKQAEELTKKVTRKTKEKQEVQDQPSEEKLDKQLKAILDDTDIDI